MKARHIIMIIVLVIFASIMFSLKDAKDTKTLICKVDNKFEGMDSKTTLEVKVKNNAIKDMDIKIDVTIPEEYQSQKQNIIDSIAASGKMNVTSTKEGMRLQTDINSDYFKSLGLSTTTSYSELQESLEMAGYSCK